jgi:ferrous iron transport protein A
MKLVTKLAALGAAIGVAQATFLGRKGEKEAIEETSYCQGPCPACDVCPLSSMGVGQACCLMDVGAGRRLRHRLAELGLTPGVEMTVLQNTGGPVLVCVRNSRLALGRQMAHKLDVRPLAAGDEAG